MKLTNIKYIYYCIILLMILIGCTEKYSTLIITIKNNDNNVFNFPELNKLVIKKDNKIFKTILPSNKNPFIDNPIKIDSLERGIYQFEYIDLFGRNQIKTYEVKNRKNIDSLFINPDYIDISKHINKSIIKGLKNNKVVLKYESKGCFHMVSDSIIVVNKNSTFSIINKGKSRELKNDEIEKLVRFESELYAIPQKGGCTTVENYKIKFNNKIRELINGNCSWSGWNKIKNELKLLD